VGAVNDGFYMPWESTSNDCYFKSYIASGYYQRYLLVLPWDVLYKTLPLSSAPFFVTHKQASFSFFAELFAGASFNASFIDGLRVMVYLWPIQFNIWKASMSLRNLYLQYRPHIKLRGMNPMLVTHFTERKVGMHLTGLTHQALG
jgi:hypothetical protein